MKKLLSFIMCAVIIAVSFCACSGPNADMTEENITETVTVVETALKEFNTEDLEKYVDSSTLSIIMGYAKEHQQFIDLGKAIFENLDIEIKSIDTENSTVTVSVTNKDLYQAAGDFASQLKADYSTLQLLNKLNDNDFLNRKLTSLCEDIDNCEMMPEPTEVTLSIEAGKKNLVLIFDDEAENAVSGGALTGIKSIYG